MDVQGRKVRELIAGEFPAGNHRVTWEGRDDNRALVGPGLYFARLVTGNGEVKVQKLFKIR
jgi:flagellar hook assembly protein FlgD